MSITEKVIGGGVVGVLAIAGITVSVTQEDIATQYRENTGKELTITEDDLVSFDEIIIANQEFIITMQEFVDGVDCINYEYEFVDTCESVVASTQDYIEATKQSNICFDSINNDTDLQISDMNFCIDAMSEEKIVTLDFNNKISGYCDDECEYNIDACDYNLAIFQAYLNNLQ